MNKKIRKTFFNESLLAAFLFSAGCLVAASASADVPRFVDPPFISTGLYASAMVTADFNGDGIPDAGSINNFDREIAVTLGNGDGTFQPTQIYNVGAGPSDMKTADLNGDGKPDLVVSLQGDKVSNHWVVVLLGNGDGTFRMPVKFEGGRSPSAVGLGDLNEDGKIDVVVSNAFGVGVLLGNGDGTLQPPVTYGTGNATGSVVLSDFNGDGHLDAAAINFSDSFIVLFGNGNGTFGTAVSYPTPHTIPVQLVAADFNHDSHPDFAVKYFSDPTVSVFLGNSDGTFQPGIDTPVPFYDPRNIAAADLNGDGFADLVVAGNALTVFVGKGDGTFEAPVGYYKSAYVVTPGQFDGTGGVDVLVFRQRDDFGFNFISGNTDGTFNAPRSFPAPIPVHSAAASDLNGDRKPDVVVASTVSSFDNQGQVSVFLNTGGGVLAPRVDYPTGHNPEWVAIADVNNDGLPDLVTSNQADNSVSVLLGTGGGAFQNAIDYSSGTSPVSVVIADFDKDGTADLATANNAASGTISILLGAGDGSFPSHTELPAAAYPGGVAAGDLDGDGNIDLAVSYQNSGGQAAQLVSVFLGHGDGTFDARTDYSLGTAGNSGGPIAIADVDGDTKPDLVAGASSLGVHILLNNGDGTFQPPVTSPDASGLESLQLGDVDGDGSVDLVLGSFFIGSHNGLLLGNGDGTFSRPEHFFDFGIGTALADFNNDGALDVADVPSNIVSIVLNTGGSHVSLLSSENPSHAGEEVTFRARVSPTVGSAIPSGTVEFLDRDQTLATVALVDGNARFTTSSLSIGRHGIHGRYSGDAIFVPRESKTKTQIVQP